ncbi:hypothetical protein OROGR_027802 [Orobanche gracilis]
MTAKMGELGEVNSNDNVRAEEARLGLGSWWKSWVPRDPALIGVEYLSATEEAAGQVLNCVHPTLDSEEKRRDVIDYVQQLVQSHLNCEVVSYGSVPLKTYLPDGDIDLTVLQGPNAGDSLAHDVLALLQDEEQNKNTDYQVKDTQFIDAEVKLVKCFVQNFVIDISFNQFGGLSTLCFLEQVDRLVGRDHLFKRSIILIKSWCYYESRILGAHHGLISTYALEILVLYIFHHFHSLLSGPLSALYRFLDYYSQFDWENYCISLKGPVCKSSLPDIVVEMPEDGCNDLLLNEKFLEKCLELFSVPFRGFEANPKAFQAKHLNIIDPLKENNNLGRSVHRGNFYRIRSAFKFGAHKLGQVLSQPRDKVADEICNFFTNTRARHEHHYRSRIRSLALDFADEEESFTESLSSPVDLLSEDDMLLKSYVTDSDNASVGGMGQTSSDLKNEIDRYSMREVSPDMASEVCHSSDGIFVSGYCLSGDNKYSFATSNSSLKNGTSESFSKSSTENGSSEAHQFDLASDSEKFGFISCSDNREKLVEMNNSTYRWCVDISEPVRVPGSSFITEGNILENPSLDFREIDSESIGGESEALDHLANLSGDYDGNIRSLLRGQLCLGFSSSSTVVRNQNKKPWDIPRQSMPLEVNNFSQNCSHKVSTDHTPHTAFNFDGNHKARGTGTYFPHTNVVCMERSSHGRGKNKAPGNENHFRRSGHINRSYPFAESNSFENGSPEAAPARRRYYGRKRRSDVQSQSNSLVGGGTNQKSEILRSASCRIEFGSIGEELISVCTRAGASKTGVTLKSSGSTAVLMCQRVAGQSIHLKNEDEFPPLCQ